MDKKIIMDRKSLLQLRLDGETYQHIAEKAGVSRQRVQSLLSPPSSVRKYIVSKYSGRCDCCGILVGKSGHVHHRNTNNGENYQDIENLQLLCLSCHRKEHRKPPEFTCRQCGKPINNKNRIFCNQDCSQKYHKAFLTCSYCSKEFETTTFFASLRIRKSISGLIFCSKHCQGAWLGKNHGGGRMGTNNLY